MRTSGSLEDAHADHLGDVDHLEHLEVVIRSEGDQDAQGDQHSHSRRVEHLARFDGVNEKIRQCPSRPRFG